MAQRRYGLGMCVTSLSIRFETTTSGFQAVAPWGSAEGPTFEEAYWAVMALRREATVLGSCSTTTSG